MKPRMENQTLAATIIHQQRLEDEKTAFKWDDLPRDVFASILSWLRPFELLTTVQYVCRLWRDVCRDPLTWRRISIGNCDADVDVRSRVGWLHEDSALWYRLAVDRSLGSLESITIQGDISDNLLNYIIERSPRLKHLRLISCVCNFCHCYYEEQQLSAKCMISVAAKVPLLEELEFLHCEIPDEVIEAFARCCPLLASFEFVPWWSSRTSLVGRVIAHQMPRLVHLKLGGDLTSDGLLDILDGCPRLESLDLYNCCFIDLDGELGVRCGERIKKLRRPYDPAENEREECCSGSCCNILYETTRPPCYFQYCHCYAPPCYFQDQFRYLPW